MELSQIDYKPWNVVRELGRGSFGTVYEIRREEFGETYKAALKVITIPQTDSDIVANRADGMDDMSITAYYNSVVQELTHEFALLSKLKGHTNIVGYEDHKVVQHNDGIGWDIYIRMELLSSLTTIAATRNFSRNEVIKLGMDICSALIVCEQKSIVHRDIKPDNIFISENGDFELGDFGIARTASKTMSNMSRKGTPNYMAPEVYMNQPYNATADIYSLGIVLYQMMNNRRLPFIPAQVTVASREEALGLRMSGHVLPAPEQADQKLASIILKACAYRPEDRYASAKDMKKDLEKMFVEEENINMNNHDATQFNPQNNMNATIPPQNGQYTQPQNMQYQNGQYTQPQNMQYQNGQYTQPQNMQYQNGQYMQQQNTQPQFQSNQTQGGQYQTNAYNQSMNDQTWTGATQVQSDWGNGFDGQMTGGNNTMNNLAGNNYQGNGAGNSAGNGGGKKTNVLLIAGIAAGVLVLLLVVMVAFMGGKKGIKQAAKDENTEIAVTTPDETEETKDTVAEKQEDVKEEIVEEEPAEEATGLSDKLSDYMFELDGYRYQLPVSYADFKETGWELDPTRSATEEDELAAGQYDWFDLTNGVSTIDCYIFNASGNTKAVKDCNIGGITVYAKDNLDFRVAKGIEPTATVDEIKAAFGTPTSSSTYDSTETMKYQSDPDDYQAYTTFSIDSVKAANNYIELHYFVATEADETEVSDEAPDYLAEYVAPSASDINKMTMPAFELDGVFYRLPCPISVFMDNGWEITSMQESALGGQNKSSYCVTLKKGELELSPYLANFDKNAQKIENCVVTGIDLDDYGMRNVDDKIFHVTALEALGFAGTFGTVKLSDFEAGNFGFSKDESDTRVSYEYDENEISIRFIFYTDGTKHIVYRNGDWDY